MQMPMAHPLSRLGDLLGAGHLLSTRLRAKAPEVEQGLQGQVEGAGALQRQLLAEAHQLQQRLRHDLTTVGRRGIEATDQRVAAVGRQLLIDLGQDRLSRRLGFGQGRPGAVAQILDRVTAAHGRAGKLLDLLAATQQTDATQQHNQQPAQISHRNRPAGYSRAQPPGPAASSPRRRSSWAGRTCRTRSPPAPDDPSGSSRTARYG